jgi:putative iron-regulated protein
MAMAKRAKVWTALGVAVLAGATVAEAGALKPLAPPDNPQLILADGEGGEGGGEGGTADASTTYALQSTDASAYAYDATPQIAAYVALAHKSYEKAADDAVMMEKAVEAFLANPSAATLDAARNAWVAARPAYLHTEAFRFYDGPIDAVEGEINSWPMNEAFIDYVEGKPDAGIINDPKVTLDIDMLEGVNQKQDETNVTIGWHAIEFLLWGQDLSVDGPGVRPFTDYIAGQGNNDRRRAYLKLVTSQLVKELQALEEKWEEDEAGSYAASFKALPQREAIGRMVNGMAILAGYEFMSERLAVALDSGDQEDEHSCFSDTTKQDYVHDLVGIKAVWTDAKLAELVKAQDAEHAARVDGLFADAEAKIAALGDPWDKVLASPKESPARNDAEAAVASLQNLADGLKAVGNKLGVLVLMPTG